MSLAALPPIGHPPHLDEIPIQQNGAEEVDQLPPPPANHFPLPEEDDLRERQHQEVIERQPHIPPPQPRRPHNIRRRLYLFRQLLGERPRPPGELEREDLQEPDPDDRDGQDQELRHDLGTVPGDDDVSLQFLDLLLGIFIPCVPVTLFLVSVFLLAIEFLESKHWFRCQSPFTPHYLLIAAVTMGLVSVWTILKLFTRSEFFLPRSEPLNKAKWQLARRLMPYTLFLILVLFPTLSSSTILPTLNRGFTPTTCRDLVGPSFRISLLLVSVIDLPASIFRMGGPNKAIRYIALYEAKAYLHNYLLIICPFLIYDFLGLLFSSPPPEPSKWEAMMSLFGKWRVPGKRETTVDEWRLFFVAYLGTLAFGFVVSYPQIDVPRRAGIVGQDYMEYVAGAQMDLDNLYGIYIPVALLLIRDLLSFISTIFKMGGMEGWVFDHFKERQTIDIDFWWEGTGFWNNANFHLFALVWAFLFRCAQRLNESARVRCQIVILVSCFLSSCYMSQVFALEKGQNLEK